jgi:hypothetical protein
LLVNAFLKFLPDPKMGSMSGAGKELSAKDREERGSVL